MILVIPDLEKLRQKDHKVQGPWCYIVRPCYKTIQTIKLEVVSVGKVIQSSLARLGCGRVNSGTISEKPPCF